MVVFTLLLNRVGVLVNFMFNLNGETWQWKGQHQLQLMLSRVDSSILSNNVFVYGIEGK